MVGMSYRDPVTKALIKIPTGCAGGGTPVGVPVPYVGSVAPVGWVICDGRAHNSPALKALLGSDNTPDLRGKFILAASATHAAKTTGGEETHLLTAAESGVAEHGHEMTLRATAGTTNSSDGPVRGQSSSAAGVGFRTGVVAATSMWESPLGPKPAAEAHNNMPPFYALMYIIKAWDEAAPGGITMTDADARYVNVAGDTMTGALILKDSTGEDSSLYLRSKGPDGAATTSGRVEFVNDDTGQPLFRIMANSSGSLTLRAIDSAGVSRNGINIARTTALATVVGDPTAALGIATKQYVDGPVTAWAVACKVAGGAAIAAATPSIDSTKYQRVGNRVIAQGHWKAAAASAASYVQFSYPPLTNGYPHGYQVAVGSGTWTDSAGKVYPVTLVHDYDAWGFRVFLPSGVVLSTIAINDQLRFNLSFLSIGSGPT